MNTRTWLAIRTVLTLIVLAGLALDAYVHFDLAWAYAAVKTSTLSGSDMFRFEGALAILAALLLAIRPHRYTVGFAFLVTAGGAAAVLVYRYVNVGGFGPVPNMYEPNWYGEKTLSAWAEGIGALAALALLVALILRARSSNAVTPRRAARV